MPLHRFHVVNIDRTTLWGGDATVKSNASGGFNFTIAWRYQLPAIYSTALSPFGFVINTAPALLGFQANLIEKQVNGGIINIVLENTNCMISSISFTILIETEESKYFELNTIDYSFSSYEMTINYYWYVSSFTAPMKRVNTLHSSWPLKCWMESYYTVADFVGASIDCSVNSPTTVAVSVYTTLPPSLKREKIIIITFEPHSFNPNIAFYSA